MCVRLDLHPLLDEKERDCFGWLNLGRCGARVDEIHVAKLTVAHRPVRDPHLGAIQLPTAIGKLGGGRPHRENIRPRLWLGHAHASDGGAGAGGGKEAFTLLPCPVPRQIVHKELRVREVREAERRVRVRKLLVYDARSDGVHPCAAVRGIDGDAQQPQLARAREELAVERLAFLAQERRGGGPRAKRSPEEDGFQHGEGLVRDGDERGAESRASAQRGHDLSHHRAIAVSDRDRVPAFVSLRVQRRDRHRAAPRESDSAGAWLYAHCANNQINVDYCARPPYKIRSAHAVLRFAG